MNNEEFYIDFDGVIVDSQKKVDYYFSLFGGEVSTPKWNRFLEEMDWVKLLKESNEIDNSFDVLKELYKLKKEVYILSRVFSNNEAKAKIEYLRDNGIQQDFITCPGRIKKSRVVIPNENRLLVDDSLGNIEDWQKNGGKTILIPSEEQNIKCLLKRL